MRASSLNYRDLVMPKRGYGSYTGQLPLIPISDGVGQVIDVGADVTSVRVGDRVCPTYFQGRIGGETDLQRLTQSLRGPIDETMTEVMCLSEQGVVPVPDYLSDIQAASLPCAALTAWSAVVTYGHVKSGEERMDRATAQHKNVPVTDKVFAFEALKEAMTYLKSGAQFGKVCIAH